ncbi:MAG: DNA methyltransferase [Ktedonobacteraceae bacterium]
MSRHDAKKELVKDLVQRFSENHHEYTHPKFNYNETFLRTDFLNPFLEALGWDVENKKHAPQHLREVVHEANVQVDDKEDEGSTNKKPDYAFRVAQERKFFLEAKKPSVAIVTNSKAAFQVRRYGWNARMSISVLSNFDKLILYDCRQRPGNRDNVAVGRLKIYNYTEYVEKFDEIYDQISREAVFSGEFDKRFDSEGKQIGTERFDQYFLNQIEGWRKSLAEDLLLHNPLLNQDDINALVQRLIDRIIFLRVCEDRELEKYESLKEIKTYQDLKTLFIKADKRYNSGLFDFVEDQLSLNIEIASEVLIHIFKALYFPESPYAFAVVETDVISEIYEIFLGKTVELLDDKEIRITPKPEIVESSGVVSTPKYIVDKIVQKTLKLLCQGKSPIELSKLRIADIACGSGIFLLAAYEYLLNYHIEWYLNDGPDNHRQEIYEGISGSWYLSLTEKRRILLSNIYGVDLDLQAVEVTQFSLLLKILENETAASINAYLTQYNMRALPKLADNILWGNSLVDSAYAQFDKNVSMQAENFAKLNPLDWEQAFPKVIAEGGFDLIIGNPPYIRIQNMVKYSPNEVQYYKSRFSPYSTAKNDNFDKYALFIERSLFLLKSSGSLGYIVPNHFFKTKAGAVLRNIIASNKYLTEITDFGVQQIFARQTTTYTCILLLSKMASPLVRVEYVTNLYKWRYGNDQKSISYSADDFDERPWRLVPPQLNELFERLLKQNPSRLKDVYNIFVGLQTSDDKIYILYPRQETADSITFEDVNGRQWTIERSIVRPALYDIPVPAFATPRANTYMIFPYHTETITLKNGKTVQRAILYTPDEMQNQFPECWQYLNEHKDRLEIRKTQGYTPETWYRYGRSQSLTKFDGQSKLIWSTLSLDARYAYDEGNILFTGGGNGPYYALRQERTSQYALFYVQAILHHPVFEAMIHSGSVRVRGDYSSRGKQFIADIPIKMIDFENKNEHEVYSRIVLLVQQLNTLTNAFTQAKLPKVKIPLERQLHLLRKQVNELINTLYIIGEDDLRWIEEFSKTNEFFDSNEKG